MKTDDVRITSYVMNELDGETRNAFEREMAASTELRQAVESTQKLRDLLQTMPPPTAELTEEQRLSLREQCLQNTRVARRKVIVHRAIIIGGLVTAAACIMLLCSLPAITGSLSKSKVALENTKNQQMQKPALPASNTLLAEVASQSSSIQNNWKKKSVSDEQSVAQPYLSTVTIEEAESSKSLTVSSPVTGGVNGTASGKLMRGDRLVAENTFEQPYVAATLSPSNKQPIGGVPGATRATDGFIAVGDIPFKGRAFRMEGDKDSKLYNNEAYDTIVENGFLDAGNNPLSTFSIDVDTASYANVRRFLMQGQMPPPGAVRTEELLNYFTYSYPQPEKDVPFSVNIESALAPWNDKHILVRIGLKGRELPAEDRPASNLVFLIDVSGSMMPENKLPLLKRCLETLVQRLDPQDRVAIVVYAGSSGLVLPSTSCRDKTPILEALERLRSGGSTNGGAGIKLAYKMAEENFLKEGNNRVILCTDGDFNVGVTNKDELVKLMERERTSGVYLTLLGFGTENLKDSTMQKIADKGNGNYSYIDSFSEGRKVLIEQMGGTLFTIAKDVKIQVEFNPAYVAGYRLVGYEKRLLEKEDFNNDKKDAGEIGAGHTVTALYEVVPAGERLPDQSSVDALKYQKPSPTPAPAAGEKNNELMTVKLRYKAPDGDTSKLIEKAVAAGDPAAFSKASSDFQFAAAVAAFGMKLRNSPHHGNLSWEDIQRIVRTNLGEDPGSYRAEFLTLVEKLRHMEEPADSER